MFQKVKSFPWRSNEVQLLVVGMVFLLLQAHKVFNLAPLPENIWDNVYLWDWARNFSLGETATFVPNSHHLMRWGDWAFASILIWLFSDEVLYYYLSTIIPSTLGGLIFVYICYRYIGFVSAIIFSLFWYFDILIFRATFQLLPAGAVLLPIALCLLILVRIAEDGRLGPVRLLSLSLITFWIYGVKETYLAFFPGIVIIVFHFGGLRGVAGLCGVMVAGYMAETLFFRSISEEFSWLGRVWMLLHDGQHLHKMLEWPSLIAGQNRYFDSGITMRWARAPGITSTYFFCGFVFALATFSKQFSNTDQKNYSPHQVMAILLISFMVFTSFFIVSISPIRLGQPLQSRYITVAIPFCYLLIIWFCGKIFSQESLTMKVAVLAVLPFLFAPAINRFIKYPERDIGTVSESYSKLGRGLVDYDCARAKKLSVVRNELDLIPLEFRSPLLQEIIANGKNYTRDKKKFFVLTTPKGECTKTFSFRRQHTMRR